MSAMGGWERVRRPMVVMALVLANAGIVELAGLPPWGAADVDLLS